MLKSRYLAAFLIFHSSFLIAIVLLFQGCSSTGGECGGNQIAGCAGSRSYYVRVEVTGLTGVLVLQNSVYETTVVMDGAFSFEMADKQPYSVTVKQQPWGQSCIVSNGTGTVNGANVTNIFVNCMNTPYLSGIVWAGSQFVAVGTPNENSDYTSPLHDAGIILISPDGITWTIYNADSTDGLNSVAYSGTQFVAGGNNGAIITSPDGIRWTQRNVADTNAVYGLAWSGSQFVAVGGPCRNNMSTVTGTIINSPDGITWTTRLTDPEHTLSGVVWSGTQFVAVGQDVIRNSSEGVQWTTQLTDSALDLKAVAWSGSQYIAVGAANTIIIGRRGAWHWDHLLDYPKYPFVVALGLNVNVR